MNKFWLFPLFFLPFLGASCARQIEAPPLNVKAVAAQALAEYDSNKDGFLDYNELEHCPGLLCQLKQFDQDNDSQLSQTEIEEGLATLIERRIGLMGVVCSFKLNGQPLAGASVVFEPESFLPNLKPASGTTDERGQVRPRIEGAPFPGCNLGLYRLRISKTGADGQELLPARYNTRTQLGLAISPKMRGSYAIRLTTP